MTTKSTVSVWFDGLIYPPPHTVRVGEEQALTPLLAVVNSPKRAEFPVVAIVTGKGYSKILSNIEEVKSRGGKLIIISTIDSEDLSNLADHFIFLDNVSEFHDSLTPILTSIPLQLLAYHIAVLKGCNVDQPRNLAKSVTVE